MLEPNHDLHVHTYLSACCGDKENHRPAGILAIAEEMGLDTVGFADHVWVNPDIEPTAWYAPQDETQIARLREDLSAVDSPVRVLVGCEAETIAPGHFGITPEFAASLDFVLLACSHFHMAGFVEQPPSHSPRDVGRHMLKFFRSAVESGLATSIAHPFHPLGYFDERDAAVATLSDAELSDAFGLAAERGVALEITAGYLPAPEKPETAEKPRMSVETPLRFLALAKQAGCKFTFGTDAHEPDSQLLLPQLKLFVDALELTRDDILPLALGA